VHDGYGATALYTSASGASELALLLIEKGANVNTRTGVYIDGPGNKTPLQMAVGNPNILAALINAGANLDDQDSNGATALHRAVMAESIASVKLLLDAGANPELRDKRERRPVDWIKRDSESITERFILKLLTDYHSKHNKTEQSNR